MDTFTGLPSRYRSGNPLDLDLWPGSYTIWQVLCNAVTLGSISYSWEILKICIRQWHLQIYAKMNDIPSPGRKSRCIYRQAIEETFYELFNPSPTMCSQCSPDKENTSGGCWWHLRGAQYLLRSHDRVQLWLNICAFSAFSNSMSLSAWSLMYHIVIKHFSLKSTNKLNIRCWWDKEKMKKEGKKMKKRY